MKNNLITLALIAVAALGGFWGGMKYQQSQVPAGGARQFGQAGQRGTGTNRNGFRPVNGEVLSVDNGSFSVKMTDGSSKIVILNDKTTVNKSSTADKSEIKTGITVSVFGTDNADGSVTAQSVSLNPIFRMPSPTATPTGK